MKVSRWITRTNEVYYHYDLNDESKELLLSFEPTLFDTDIKTWRTEQWDKFWDVVEDANLENDDFFEIEDYLDGFGDVVNDDWIEE